MTVVSRTAAMMLALVLAVVMTACTTAPDTGRFERAVNTIGGVNGTRVEVQHPGLPTNTDIVTWVFVDSAEVTAVSELAREVAQAIQDDAAVRGQTVRLALVLGDPADYPDRSDVTGNTVGIMHVVAEHLGLPESNDTFLTLDRDAVARLTSDGR